MKKFKFVCFLLIVEVFLNLIPVSGIAEIYTEAGAVSSDVSFDPFYGYTPIYTKQDLDNVRNDLNGQYYLANDIAFEAADFEEGGEFYNDGKGWLPIGYAVIVNGVMAEDKPFTGTFDGCNHSVKGLKMNPSGSGVFTAMFAYNTGKIYRLDLEAELFYSNTTKSDMERRYISLLCVKNWGIIESCSTSGKLEARILAEDIFNDTVNAGAISSYNYGTIKRCSNSAEMIFSVPVDAAWAEYPINAAGICDENHRIITDCFNSGNITSNTYSSGYKNISGIVGSNYGIIRNTFNTGKIKNDGHGYPITRYNSGSGDVICENNVFLSDEEYLNSMPFLPGTKEASIAQMMQSSTYAGWDFSGIWEIDEGVSLPRLRSDPRNLSPELNDYSLGNGTQESPYVITDAKEFMHINDYPSSCFRLDADIVINNENAYVTAEFKGMLDGNGYSLNNMFPLFKFNYGTISDLYIDDVQFEIPEGQNFIGGFVSTNSGYIVNCHISGSITGLSSIYTNNKQVEIGGISASNFGVIRQCSSDVSISVFFEEYKENYIGGITGRNDGHIIECRSDADIIAGDCYYSARVGGIAGLNQVNVTAYDNPRGLIERCYYSGDIIGFKDGTLTSSSYYGGIAGESGSLYRSEYGQAYIKDCYFIGTISVIASYDSIDTPYNSGAYAGGIAGLNNTYSAVLNCYAAGSVEGISDNEFNQVRAGAGLGDCKGTASFTAADFGIRGIYDNYMNGSVNMCSPEEMRSADAY
ncbi:MAG: M26 family metallopeptidase, partial [Saccharofermentanales bacterium]